MTAEFEELGRRVSAARAAAEARGETFYQGASRVHLAAFPPRERWDDWVELSSRAWPAREEKHYTLVPTTCFNCESACGLLAYVDRETGRVRKFEGNPEHPGSRGRNCAKGPATINQVGPARTGSPSAWWPAGGWTGTTRTPTCARAAAGPGSSSGWASTGPAPTTPTRR